MKRSVGVAVLLVSALASCRHYDFESRVSGERGLVPAEQFARYGREQAALMAAGRELAQADSAEQAAATVRGLDGVDNVTTNAGDPWLTLKFASGWRAATVPIPDGKRATETPGVTTKP